MDQARRERLRELIQALKSAQEQVHNLWIEEESAFEGRKPPSKETELGQFSSDAVHHLEAATHHIEDAIDRMQSAAGDDSADS